MKSTLYIKHDLYAVTDIKIMKLIEKFHEAGYGVWWAIVELLSQEQAHSISKELLVSNVKTVLRAKNATTISAVIDFCVELGMLKENEGLIFNERIIRQCDDFEKISKQNSENCKKRWEDEKKAKETNENDTVVYENDTVVENGNTNKIKENKINKRKEYISFVQECYKNSCSEKFPKLIKMSDVREAHCYNLVEKFGKDKVKEGFEKASKSAFLTGVNDNGWKATFDWLVLPSNFLKVLEGNYDNKEPIKKLPKSSVCTAGAFEGQKNAQGGFDL